RLSAVFMKTADKRIFASPSPDWLLHFWPSFLKRALQSWTSQIIMPLWRGSDFCDFTHKRTQ
ncbi:hypothetical protein ACD591_05670, partial [Rufibacter glacialis]